jgi:hypothetical protein
VFPGCCDTPERQGVHGSTRCGMGVRRRGTLVRDTVRRRLEVLIPIVLVAILVQIVAPIAAFRAVADATSDPLAMAAICTDMASMASSRDDQKTPAETPHAHQCCAFCGAGHGGAVPIDPPQPVFATLHRQYQRISWLQATDPIPAIRAGSNAQARAPPQLT